MRRAIGTPLLACSVPVAVLVRSLFQPVTAGYCYLAIIGLCVGCLFVTDFACKSRRSGAEWSSEEM